MCVLKAYSADRSFKKFEETTSIPVYSRVEKGEIRNQERGTCFNEFRISFDVSERDWDDFPGQVEDATAFLKRWEESLAKFCEEFRPDEFILDFPLYSRLTQEIVNQNDYLPRELIRLAGRLGLGIGISTYSRDAFED